MTNTRKVVIVSGGMGGVGRAAAEMFAHEQYRVVVLYRHSSSEEVAVMRGSLVGEHVFMQCDVTNESEVARMIESVLLSEGRIDVAVHAAADPIAREKIISLDTLAFRNQFEAGFFGAFNFFKSVAKVMKQQGYGTLVGVTSSVIESATTPARMGPYAVSKIAFRGLLRELHRELSPAGIRVFAVAPELMRTGLNADLPEKVFEIAEKNQGGALMTPADVARAIVQLCADAAVPSGTSHLVSSGETSPL